jgi:predicted DNA-binding protein
MARKKTEARPMTVTAEPEVKTKPVRLDLSPDLHQMLRVVAAEQGKPMAVFAREIVEKTIKEMHGKRRKP